MEENKKLSNELDKVNPYTPGLEIYWIVVTPNCLFSMPEKSFMRTLSLERKTLSIVVCGLSSQLHLTSVPVCLDLTRKSINNLHVVLENVTLVVH